jgi:hypothetical protein
MSNGFVRNMLVFALWAEFSSALRIANSKVRGNAATGGS